MTDSTLIEMLKTAREYAYAPYSGHAVGAVAESPDGRRFAAANVETAHYKSLCAEAVAIAAMIGAGYRRLGRVYIMGPGSDPCTPCGDCRQRIHEFATARTTIHILDTDGNALAAYTIDQLLPDAYGAEIR